MLAQDEQPQRFVSVEVRLTDAWNGTPGDLHAISRLEHCYRLKMEGTAVTDEVIEPLGALPALLEMRLFDSSVTPTVVNQLKTQHPDVTFYVVNTAKLGIGGEMVEGGIRITIVESDSGAEQADLKVDDIISEFNGQPLKHFDGLTARIAQHHPGDTVDLAIIRSDQQLTKTVTLGKWDPAQRR
jgi:membrane-associated protease RseP (regulator of RpoE activity)